MCKNNFTNENEFDFSLWDDIHILPAPRPDDIPYDYWVLPDEVCNPSGPSNLDDVYNFYGPTIIIKN